MRNGITPQTARQLAAMLEQEGNALLAHADYCVERARQLKAQARRIRELVEDDAEMQRATEWTGEGIRLVEAG